MTTTARAGVQHHPHRALLVEAELDEVVPGTERAELVDARLVPQLRVPLDGGLVASLESGPCASVSLRNIVPRTPVALAAVIGAPVRYGGFDRVADRLQVIRQLVGAQRRLDGHHAAANVDADRGRNDCLLGSDHASDRRTLAGVDIGHHRDPLVHER